MRVSGVTPCPVSRRARALDNGTVTEQETLSLNPSKTRTSDYKHMKGMNGRYIVATAVIFLATLVDSRLPAYDMSECMNAKGSMSTRRSACTSCCILLSCDYANGTACKYDKTPDCGDCMTDCNAGTFWYPYWDGAGYTYVICSVRHYTGTCNNGNCDGTSYTEDPPAKHYHYGTSPCM